MARALPRAPGAALLAAALLAAASMPSTRAALVTFNNTVPRLTNTGEILDGHDGVIRRWHDSGPYWLYTLSYGLCTEPARYGCDQTTPAPACGFRLDHNVSIYTSADMSSGSWAYVGQAMDWTARPTGTVFRPDVVYNAKTSLYVLWQNWVAQNGSYMGFAAFTSPDPAGPFTLVADVVPLTQ